MNASWYDLPQLCTIKAKFYSNREMQVASICRSNNTVCLGILFTHHVKRNILIWFGLVERMGEDCVVGRCIQKTS